MCIYYEVVDLQSLIVFASEKVHVLCGHLIVLFSVAWFCKIMEVMYWSYGFFLLLDMKYYYGKLSIILSLTKLCDILLYELP